MKIKNLTLILLLGAMLVITGCSAFTKTEAPEEPAVATEKPMDPEIKSFFRQYVETDKRPIAVMIDNDDKNARPHAGLDEAYLIYEMVVEGGATRFMALYNGVNTEKIGPVRSSRHYFLDFLMENDAIYVHYGWSPKAAQDITNFGINKINGVLGGDGDTFWRERKYKGDWHSAYTSIANINDKASQRGYETTTTKKNGLKYSESYINLAPENAANEIVLPYSHRYTTGYSYNSETGLYTKSIGSEPQVMQSGKVLEVKNIIIELIPDTSLGDGTARRNINTVGEGKGYYITNGAFEEITWHKTARSDNTVYKKADGTELLINPGKTIVNVISPSSAVSIS